MGILHLPWWGIAAVVLGMTHFTIVSVTLFLHRSQAHRAVDLHPLVAHPMRFWLWLTTGMVTREWVAIHRKHHAKVETPDDPHSPHVYGIRTLLTRGAELYRREAANRDTIDRYSHGLQDDWIERHLYARHPNWGPVTMLAADLLLFGPIGLTVWAVQMLWIPFWAAGVINGLGHWWGYRNYDTRDGSTNISNIGLLIGGEELHNNHHAFPSSARFSLKPWEFDIGWGYLRLLSALRLARVRRVAPRPVIDAGKARIDMDTVKAVVSARLDLLSRYRRNVLQPVLREELARADASLRQALRRVRRHLLRGADDRLAPDQRAAVEQTLSRSATLRLVVQYRQRLQAVWEQTYANQEQLLQALQAWCREAEASGVRALQDFARRLPGYSLRPAAA